LKFLDPNSVAWRNFLEGELRACHSVLDIGCGSNSPLSEVFGEFWAVGVDVQASSLEASRRSGIHDAYVEQDVRELDFDPCSFDAVLMLDVLEHLERLDALGLLRRAEAIARKKVLIFTPNGFLPQDPYEGNPYQRHLSGWTAAELRDRGYRVSGFGGWKPLRGPHSVPRKPAPVTQLLSIVTQPLVAGRPDHAFALLAVKDFGTAGVGTRRP
jgi:SAM-dependent methyltransferase